MKHPSILRGPDQQLLKIVPKGLRSFDEHDADFFLALCPDLETATACPTVFGSGRRRIESIDADKTFRVGLIYGASGCGKSSLVKAGLLPRLAKQVMPIYIEATAGRDGITPVEGVAESLSRSPASDWAWSIP